jgi:hypothetical protein
VEQKEGRSKFRRFNRNEYANTIHDLFGFRPAVVRNLPIDGRVDGYDKISAALPFSSASAAGFVKITEDTLDRVMRPYPKSVENKYRLWQGLASNPQAIFSSSKMAPWFPLTPIQPLAHYD